MTEPRYTPDAPPRSEGWDVYLICEECDLGDCMDAWFGPFASEAVAKAWAETQSLAFSRRIELSDASHDADMPDWVQWEVDHLDG